jgi:hypothetical protein
MRPVLACLLLLAGCATQPGPVAQAPAPPPSPVAAGPDQLWRGTISCDPIPGVVRKVLVQRFELRVSGGIARYERTVLQADTGIPTDIHEHGQGVVGAAGPLTLKGDAAGGQYTYNAEYSGLLEPGSRVARLEGYQHWRFSHHPPADRACQITLRRQA